MRERRYYMLSPQVLCEQNGKTFVRGIHPKGQLGIYLQQKMDAEEASDLAFYLEQKMPYISGIDALAFSIYAYPRFGSDREVFWSGRFRNHLAPVQKYRKDNYIEFFQ